MKKEHNSNEVDRIKAMYDRGDINGAENRCNELLQIYEKEQNPNIKIIAVDVATSFHATGGNPKPLR